jgi:hypothetical protein
MNIVITFVITFLYSIGIFTHLIRTNILIYNVLFLKNISYIERYVPQKYF